MNSLHGELNHINYAFLKANAFKHAAYDVCKKTPDWIHTWTLGDRGRKIYMWNQLHIRGLRSWKNVIQSYQLKIQAMTSIDLTSLYPPCFECQSCHHVTIVVPRNMPKHKKDTVVYSIHQNCLKASHSPTTRKWYFCKPYFEKCQQKLHCQLMAKAQ